MHKRTGCWGILLAGLWAALALNGQTPNNQILSGKYYFRQLSIGTDGSHAGTLTDARSVIGTINFDGSGHYSYTGQQLTGTTAAVSGSGSGAYSVDSGGFVSLDSPLRSGAKINARYGPEAVIGSSTDSGDNTFDIFAAIPAPASGATFAGPYNAVSLEFPGASETNMRVSQFVLNQATGGTLQPISVNGRGANLGTSLVKQTVSGATYTIAADGSGTLTMGAAANSQLLSGNRVLYVSASGNVLLGGSTASGGHDILLAVKGGAASATWKGTFWGAGLRVDPTAVTGFAGAVAAGGQGKVTWSKRLKILGAGVYDFTGVNAYTLKTDGTGSMDLAQIALDPTGKVFVGASLSEVDPGAFDILFGVQVPSRSGAGVFLDPLGVVSAASFAPAGNPIAPGEFIALFGSGLAKSLQVAAVPYPKTLNGVTVTINGTQAPLYFVSTGQINCIVPYGVTGSTATIVVNNGTNSNTVTVPLAATAPGVFTSDQSGSGSGAMRHADFSLVNAANPAAPGETILVYLTGLGAVNPTVADGTAGNINTLYNAATDVQVTVAGTPAAVAFKGLAPGFPGLYQLNVTLPAPFRFSGAVPLAVQAGSAFHDQVDIPMK